MDTALRDAHQEALERAFEAGHFDVVEEKFLILLDAVTEEGAYLLSMAERMGTAQGQRGRAALLSMTLAPALREAGRPTMALDALRLASRWGATDSDLRGEAQRTLAAMYGDRPGFAFFVELSGIPGGKPFLAALDAFERSVRFKEGDAAWHARGWGYGVVKRVDPVRGSVVVVFEGRTGHVFTIDGAGDALTPLGPGHWWVRRRNESQALKELAASDPAALVREVLSGLGRPLAIKELKSEITGPTHGPPPVPPDAWTGWWNRARTVLRRDPRVTIDGAGTNAVVALREGPFDAVAEAKARVRGAKDLAGRAAVMEQVLEEGQITVVRDMAAELGAEAAAALPTTPGPAIAVALLIERTGAQPPFDVAAALAGRQAGDVAGVLALVEPPLLAREALKRVRTGLPADWQSVWAAALGRTAPETWPIIADGLDAESPDLLRPVLSGWTEHPGAAPVQAAWAIRALYAGKHAAAFAGADRYTVLRTLLTETDSLARSETPDGKEAVAVFRPVLGNHQKGILAEFLREATYGQAREVIILVRHNAAISENVRSDVTNALIARFPELVAGEQREALADDRILTTAAGLARRRGDFARLVDEEIPKNAEDLGRAIAFGDLSENAEYTAARERQTFLMRRAKDLQEEIGNARVVAAEDVVEDEVGFGTRVDLADVETGRREAFTLLGPWDADPDHGVISYLAPIGQALLGHRPGEVVDVTRSLDRGGKVSYRIESIAKALD